MSSVTENYIFLVSDVTEALRSRVSNHFIDKMICRLINDEKEVSSFTLILEYFIFGQGQCTLMMIENVSVNMLDYSRAANLHL